MQLHVYGDPGLLQFPWSQAASATWPLTMTVDAAAAHAAGPHFATRFLFTPWMCGGGSGGPTEPQWQRQSEVLDELFSLVCRGALGVFYSNGPRCSGRSGGANDADAATEAEPAAAGTPTAAPPRCVEGRRWRHLDLSLPLSLTELRDGTLLYLSGDPFAFAQRHGEVGTFGDRFSVLAPTSGGAVFRAPSQLWVPPSSAHMHFLLGEDVWSARRTAHYLHAMRRALAGDRSTTSTDAANPSTLHRPWPPASVSQPPSLVSGAALSVAGPLATALRYGGSDRRRVVKIGDDGWDTAAGVAVVDHSLGDLCMVAGLSTAVAAADLPTRESRGSLPPSSGVSAARSSGGHGDWGISNRIRPSLDAPALPHSLVVLSSAQVEPAPYQTPPELLRRFLGNIGFAALEEFQQQPHKAKGSVEEREPAAASPNTPPTTAGEGDYAATPPPPVPSLPPQTEATPPGCSAADTNVDGAALPVPDPASGVDGAASRRPSVRPMASRAVWTIRVSGLPHGVPRTGPSSGGVGRRERRRGDRGRSSVAQQVVEHYYQRVRAEEIRIVETVKKLNAAAEPATVAAETEGTTAVGTAPAAAGGPPAGETTGVEAPACDEGPREEERKRLAMYTNKHVRKSLYFAAVAGVERSHAPDDGHSAPDVPAAKGLVVASQSAAGFCGIAGDDVLFHYQPRRRRPPSTRGAEEVQSPSAADDASAPADALDASLSSLSSLDEAAPTEEAGERSGRRAGASGAGDAPLDGFWEVAPSSGSDADVGGDAEGQDEAWGGGGGGDGDGQRPSALRRDGDGDEDERRKRRLSRRRTCGEMVPSVLIGFGDDSVIRTGTRCFLKPSHPRAFVLDVLSGVFYAGGEVKGFMDVHRTPYPASVRTFTFAVDIQRRILNIVVAGKVVLVSSLDELTTEELAGMHPLVEVFSFGAVVDLL